MMEQSKSTKCVSLNTALGPKPSEIFAEGKLEKKMMDMQLDSYRDVIKVLSDDVANADDIKVTAKSGELKYLDMTQTYKSDRIFFSFFF